MNSLKNLKDYSLRFFVNVELQLVYFLNIYIYLIVRKILIVKLIFTFTFGSFAQWINIPNPPNPLQPSFGTPIYMVFPQQILPLKNGKILYSGSIKMTPSGSASSNVYYGDDYGNLVTAFNSTTPGGYSSSFYYASSFNDSVIGLNGYLLFNSNQVVYTVNGFNTTYNIGGGGHKILSHYLTSKYLYYLYNNNTSLDTVILKRFKIGDVNAELNLLISDISKSRFINDKMEFINDSVGFILYRHKNNEDKSVLISTNNKGSNWSELYVDSVNQITSFSFPTSNIGYISKKNGSVFKTFNGGLSWTQINSPTNSFLSVVKFKNDTIGYIGSSNCFLSKSIDGGNTWVQESTLCNDTIIKVFDFDNGSYFTTENNSGGIYKKGPKVISLNESNLLSTEVSVYPNPTNEILKIKFLDGFFENVNVKLIDLVGNVYYEKTSSPNFISELNVSQLVSGIYIIQFKSDKRFLSKKVIIKKD